MTIRVFICPLRGFRFLGNGGRRGKLEAIPGNRTSGSRRLLCLAWVALLIAQMLPPSKAADVYWTNLAGGSWSTAANWSTGTIPGTNDPVFIVSNGTYVVSLSADAAVGGVTIGTADGSQTLSLVSGTLTPGSVVSVRESGALHLSGGGIRGGTVVTTNGTPVMVGSGTLDGVTVNGGIEVGVSGSGQQLVVTNGLVLNGTLHLGSLAFDRIGLIDFAGSQTLSGNGTVIFGNFPGGALCNSLRLSHAGTVLTLGSNITVRGLYGTIGYTDCYGGPANVSIVNQGAIKSDLSGGIIFVRGQAITNQGTASFDGGGQLMFSGSVRNSGQLLGHSPGFLNVSGEFTQTSSGKLALAIGGTTPGGEHGQLRVSSTANLGGTLGVVLTNGFLPQVGDQFIVLTATSRTGTFATLTGDNRFFTAQYEAANLVLAAEHPVPPAILGQLQDQTVPATSNATFTVLANGTPPLSYQWFFNGTNPLSGATTAALTVTNVSLATVGAYHVVVSNAQGTATSVAASLVIDCVAAPAGLVAWWPLDGNANDLVGTNHGTVRNGATFSPGKVGLALSFDGVNDYVSVPNSQRLEPSHITVAAWANATNIPSYAYIVSKSLARVGSSYGLYSDIEGHGLKFYLTGVGTSPSVGVQIEDGQFHHIVGTYDGSLIRLFLDGQEVGTGTPATGSINFGTGYNSGALFIGTAAPEEPGESEWAGNIDEVAIFNRALTSDEIAALYVTGSAGMCPTPKPAHLLVNGSFELPGLPANSGLALTNGDSRLASWVVSSDSVGRLNGQLGDVDIPPVDGAHHLLFGSGDRPAGGAVSQSFATIIGGNYVLKFHVGRIGTGPGLIRMRATVRSSDGDVLATVTVVPPLHGYGPTEDLEFIAATPLTVVEFFDDSTATQGVDLLLDAASITPGPPLIVEQPTDQILTAGGTTSLLIEVSGVAPFSYQWLYNGNAIGGANASSLSLVNVDAARAGAYRVVVNNAFGVVTSEVATLTVLQPPLFTQQPQSQTVLVGQSVSFTANASGSLPMGFLWYRHDLPFTNLVLNIPSSTITLANVQTFDSANFHVVVTNAARPAGVASEIATLTVLAPVGILAQPTNAVASIGGSATFCVAATGSAPIRYQWRHNGANIAGATNPCLVLANVQLTDGGTYLVALENAAGTLVSDSALLSFVVPDAPPGDNFAQRVSLGTNSSGIVRSTNTFATKETGEPDHAGKPGGASVWYRWTCPSNGVATFRTVGSAFDTLLAVYTGASVAALTTVASDEDSGGFFTSQLQFNAAAGVDYDIALDGFGGAQGGFVLSWSLEATGGALPVIGSQLTSRTVTLGASTTFTVNATGGGLRYQWHFNGVALINQTNSALALSNVQAANVGNYLVAVTNSAGRGLRSEVAVLEIGPVPTVQSQDKFEDLFWSGSGGGGGGFAPASTGGGFISVSVGATTAPQILNNTGASTQSGEADHCVVISTATRWLRYRAEQAGVLVLDTLGSAIPTVVEAYSALNVLGLPTGSVACGKTNANDGRSSVVSFVAVAGKEYYVAADGFRGAVGIIQLNASLGQAPALPVANPTNAVVDAGEGIQLNAPVPLNGTSGLRYQWRLNERDIADATGATYQLSAADAANGGTYTVLIYNEYGQAIYTVGAVTVQLNYLRAEPQLLNGRLRLWVQRPASGAVVIESSDTLGAWTPLHTVPLTAPGPVLDVPISPTGPRFFRARPWP